MFTSDMLSTLFILACLFFCLFQNTNAFPKYLGGNYSRLNVSAPDTQAILKSRQLVGGLLGGLGSLAGVIPTSLDLAPIVTAGRKIIPDKDHPFIAPEEGDIRGACPGLNLMSNYGYIPRNGITTMTEMTYGMEEMLGLSPALSAVLVAFALKTSVDLTTMKMSIGQTDSRTDGPLSGILGTAPGLFSAEAHNKYEIDGSLAAVDAYFAGGQTDHFSSERWKKYRQVAIDHFGGIMTIQWVGEVRYMQYKECRDLNPECHWAAVDELAFYGAQALVATSMTSSDEVGKPRPADVHSIDTFFGIVENKDGTFSKTHSKLPPGPEGHWFRRAVPSTLLEFAETLVTTYLQREFIFTIVPFGHNNGKLGNFDVDLTQLPNLIAPNIACYILQQVLQPQNLLEVKEYIGIRDPNDHVLKDIIPILESLRLQSNIPAALQSYL
ncbi:hypothetical protein CROQUDRAFT_723950 [Cronartium quercuum f. sp. fusiforme G11]|uniref:Heme haloperoxidase family profile domain-containing protein n=1 Tax=Cronartium quercuum f. sp. fusiforme G11 TaxID=708437 RepID=A0A9P6TBD7_9BASI|nr:hypothetical protein CROQUDRAFT_723950 [Cronartium quercuum f. sp. fusiforme G11]